MGQECLEKAGDRGPSLGRRRVTLGMHKKDGYTQWRHFTRLLTIVALLEPGREGGVLSLNDGE